MARRSRYRSRELDDVAAAIGYVCIHWAWIEDVVDSLLELIAPLPEGDISRSITANIDLRAKIQMVKAAAFVRKTDEHEEWFLAVRLLLDRIDNDLRPKRNRYAHDVWITPGRRPLRRTKQMRFTKPQAHQLELSTLKETRTKASEIWKLSNDIVSTFCDLIGLAGYYSHHLSSNAKSLEQSPHPTNAVLIRRMSV